MRIVLLAIYLLLVISVIFLEHKKPVEAVMWVVILICLPYAGAVLYLVFGNTVSIRLTGWLRRTRCGRRFRQKALRLIDSPEPELPAGLSMNDEAVVRFNTTYNASPLTSYETSEFLTSGASHYVRLFEDIAAAKQSVYLEFYTIHHDEVGLRLVDALAQKAREGVCVWVMCDYIANLSTPSAMFRPLVEAGGMVKRLKPFLTHFRSHRKIVVIDQQTAYIGGMNIGRQYANGARKKNPWRDTQLRLTGACVSALTRYFLTDWVCALSARELGRCRDTLLATPPPAACPAGRPCQMIGGGVEDSSDSIKMCYLSMIRAARKRIRIQSPYFVPDSSILDALKTAAASGVAIELMIPGIQASFFLDPVTRYYCAQLMEYGAAVYKYRGYIHAKTMIIDNEILCVGSVNMDIRSLEVSDEICGLFYDDAIVREYSEIFDLDIESCNRYSLRAFHARPWFEKVKERFFLLFAPLM